MAERVIDRLNKWMPELVNKTGPAYTALFGKTDYTPNNPVLGSNDVQCGAIANELEFLRVVLKDIIASFDIENAHDTLLDDIGQFFIAMPRSFDEEDTRYQARFYFFLRKLGNVRWNTRWAVKDAFYYLFPTGTIYVEENYVETDLMLNGGFETAGGGGADVFANWTESTSGSSTVVANNTEQLVGGVCCELNVDASNSQVSVSQVINSVAASKVYKFCLFYKDVDCPATNSWKLYLTRSGDNYYWNPDTGAWQVGLKEIQFPKVGNVWTYGVVMVDMPTGAGTKNLTFTLWRDGGAVAGGWHVYLDRVMFGEWMSYPSIKVLLITSGQGGGFVAANATAADDNLIVRGECESATPPAMQSDTTNTVVNASFARDNAQKKMAAYSYKHTLTTTGSDSTIGLHANENTNNMHGLTAGVKYTFAAWCRINTGTGPTWAQTVLSVGEYYSAAWHDTDFAFSGASYDLWQAKFGTLTLNASTTGVRVRLKILAAAASGKYVWWDDIRYYAGDFADLSKAGYFDQDYIGGEGGGYPSDLYNQLLQRIKTAGSKATLETLAKAV